MIIQYPFETTVSNIALHTVFETYGRDCVVDGDMTNLLRTALDCLMRPDPAS